MSMTSVHCGAGRAHCERPLSAVSAETLRLRSADCAARTLSLHTCTDSEFGVEQRLGPAEPACRARAEGRAASCEHGAQTTVDSAHADRSGEWDWEEHARFVEAYGFDPSA